METQRLNPTELEQWPQAYLIPIGQDNEQTIPVNDFLTIGRDPDNQCRLTDPFASTRHARIEKKGHRYLLRDMRSRNGTQVNGTQVVEAFLQDNDKINFGESGFIFSKFERPANLLTSKNPQWNEQLKRLPAFAHCDYTVLINGPSGSGKEIIARWLHDNSLRRQQPFITINCSALGEHLIESELFGHVKGAFTDASDNRKGAFEAARGGTIFLDEIGDLPLSLQPKLLRTLENFEIRPVGSDRTVKINVRVIAATHKHLKAQVMDGQFREDLYHRLNICKVSPPSLIERMEDFEQILYSLAKENRVGFNFAAIEKLKNHTWPGNIRELKNTVLRAAAYFPGRRIAGEDVEQLLDAEPLESLPVSDPSLLPPVRAIERDLIVRHLKAHFGNQRRVSEDLQIPKSTLNDKIRAYGIDPILYKRRGKVI